MLHITSLIQIYIINTERYTESNHLSVPLQFLAWHEGAHGSFHAICLLMSDVWLWTVERNTSIFYERYSEKWDLLLTLFNTNLIKWLLFADTWTLWRKMCLYSLMRSQRQSQKSQIIEVSQFSKFTVQFEFSFQHYDLISLSI